MSVLEDHLLRVYLDARLIVSHHPDDPTPIADVWAAQRAVELMLIARGWSETDLNNAFARYERESLLALTIDGWRAHLVEALAQSTDRSVRVAQALTRYREQANHRE